MTISPRDIDCGTGYRNVFWHLNFKIFRHSVSCVIIKLLPVVPSQELPPPGRSHSRLLRPPGWRRLCSRHCQLADRSGLQRNRYRRERKLKTWFCLQTENTLRSVEDPEFLSPYILSGISSNMSHHFDYRPFSIIDNFTFNGIIWNLIDAIITFSRIHSKRIKSKEPKIKSYIL